MKKKLQMITAFCLTMVLLLSMAGCGQGTPASSPDDTATRTITDLTGRQVEVPTTINSVACTGMQATRMAIYAGGIDKISAVSNNEKGEKNANLCGPIAYVYSEQLQALPAIASGFPQFEIYPEEMVTVDPDVILHASADATELDDLQAKTQIPVIGVGTDTDFSTEQFRQTMALLGDLLGTTEQTDALIAYVDGCIADLDTRTKDIPDSEKPSVYYGGVSFRGYNGMDATYAKYHPFEAIHANNAADNTGGEGAMTVELEQVTAWDPDIIFINMEPATLGILSDEFASNREFFKNLSAVQNGQVYAQAAYNFVNTNVELSLVNAYYAATVIYPEQFADVNFEEKAAEILTAFLREAGADYLEALNENGIGYQNVTIFEN